MITVSHRLWGVSAEILDEHRYLGEQALLTHEIAKLNSNFTSPLICVRAQPGRAYVWNRQPEGAFALTKFIAKYNLKVTSMDFGVTFRALPPDGSKSLFDFYASMITRYYQRFRPRAKINPGQGALVRSLEFGHSKSADFLTLIGEPPEIEQKQVRQTVSFMFQIRYDYARQAFQMFTEYGERAAIGAVAKLFLGGGGLNVPDLETDLYINRVFKEITGEPWTLERLKQYLFEVATKKAELYLKERALTEPDLDGPEVIDEISEIFRKYLLARMGFDKPN